MNINPVTGWLETMQYDDEIGINIENLVETIWITRYPWPTEITYGKGE